MDTLDNTDPSVARPLISAAGQINLCPLCGTFNHRLSRECFNCRWRGAFLWGDAESHQTRLQCRIKTSLVPLWWQHLKMWQHLKTWLLIQTGADEQSHDQ